MITRTRGTYCNPRRQLAEEAPGRLGVTPALHEDVEHGAILINGTPKIMLFTADADKHLVQKPFVARSWPAPFQRVGEHPTEPQAPVTNAFVTDHDAAGSQDQFKSRRLRLKQ